MRFVGMETTLFGAHSPTKNSPHDLWIWHRPNLATISCNADLSIVENQMQYHVRWFQSLAGALARGGG